MNKINKIVIASFSLVSTSHAAISVFIDDDFSGNQINDTSIFQVTSGVTFNDGRAVLAGVDGQYLAATAANAFGSGRTDNMGYEAIVNFSTFTPALDGFIAVVAVDGLGIVGQTPGSITGHRGGIGDFGPQSISLNNDHAVAMVVNGGVNQFYVDGSLIGTNSNALGAIGFFEIGAFQGSGEFTGNFDRVRTFTFDAGQFQSSDLLTVPEPSSTALLGLGGLGLLLRRRK